MYLYSIKQLKNKYMENETNYIGELLHEVSKGAVPSAATLDEIKKLLTKLFDESRKRDIIKEIVKHHPSYGTSRKWAWYVGGMKDTGRWNRDKMMEEPEEDLQNFLNMLDKFEQERIEHNKKEEAIRQLPAEERKKIYLERERKQIEEILSRNPALIVVYNELTKKK